MSDLIVRRATIDDVPVLAALIDRFANGHPAEGHARSTEMLRSALFGSQPIAHVLLAQKRAAVIGFGAWRKTYDLFWSMYGGEGLGLYVNPDQRGFSAGLCIVAAICADIRDHGGSFLQASYGTELAPLYERVAVGRPERACHVSALAFERLARVAGNSAREIIRALPEKSMNYAPTNAAETSDRSDGAAVLLRTPSAAKGSKVSDRRPVDFAGFNEIATARSTPRRSSTGGPGGGDTQFAVAELTDGVVYLRPLRQEDAADHLAGEDYEIAIWLSGGRSTMATVRSYIRSCEESWLVNGNRRAFGVYDCATNRLVGSIEANLAFPLLEPAQANVSYGVFQAWRGNGIASRALRLMAAYLKSVIRIRQMVLRISSENVASRRVAEKSGFQFLGVFEEAEGHMARYVLDLQ